MASEKSDHVIMEVVRDTTARGGKTVRVTTPDKVLRIHDVRELKAQLDHYSHPFIQHVVLPNTAFARKFYVEKVRPALRYYCLKFGEKIPEWLKNDDYYHQLPDDQKQELFGTTKLSKREFRPLVKPQAAPQ